jgi:hypothetical protein
MKEAHELPWPKILARLPKQANLPNSHYLGVGEVRIASRVKCIMDHYPSRQPVAVIIRTMPLLFTKNR